MTGNKLDHRTRFHSPNPVPLQHRIGPSSANCTEFDEGGVGVSEFLAATATGLRHENQLARRAPTRKRAVRLGCVREREATADACR